MQLISKFNKGIRFLLCVIDLFSKYAWVVSLKDKKGFNVNYCKNYCKIETIVIQKVLNKSDRKPNKIWVDKGSKFYNRSMISWLEKNGIEMYSTHKEGKSVVPERFIRTLQKKI